MKHLVDIRHVEVAAQTQVLGAPVISAQEGMHKRQSTLSRGRIAQVTHQQFSLHLFRDTRENLRNRILTLGLLTEHIFRAGLVGQAHRGNTSTLLSTVVLLLHHQVELIETIGPRTVFLLVIIQGLQQANHRHATLML